MAQQIRELMTPNPVALPGTASVHEAPALCETPILAT
jgi:hypothetical protein